MYYPTSLKTKVNNFILYNTLPRSRSSLYLTLATAFAAAQLNYIWFGYAAYAVCFILLSHEFAHYVYGKSFNGDTYYPFVIPLPVILIGLTIVKNLDNKSKADTALSGMFYGALASFILLLFNFIFPVFSPYFLIFIIIWELFYNYFIGTDGKIYKDYYNI